MVPLSMKFRSYLLVTLMSLVPTIVLWAPFYLQMPAIWGIPLAKGGMQVVVSNYDGPLYLVVAKTLYEKNLILQNFSFSLPFEYYAAHFPLYPLIIRTIATVTGYPWGMLVTTLITSVFAHLMFYKLAREYVEEHGALWLTLIFALFPARWLIVRSIGSPEPLFIGAIIASLFYFKKKQYLLAGLFGAIAQFTKSPGILLFVALVLAVLIPRLHSLAITNDVKKWVKNIHPTAIFIGFIPLALIGVFYLYSLKFGNFFAYFNSGDNIHLFFPPFQIFNYSQPWVNTHWLEEIIFIYLLGAIGLMKLVAQKEWAFASFVGVFYTTTLFVSHRDLLRYALPIVPFLIIAYHKELMKKEFVVACCVILIPIFLFSFAFISNNIMPISDWGPLL